MRRLGLDDGITGMAFNTVEWRVRDLLGIDAEGKPRVSRFKER